MQIHLLGPLQRVDRDEIGVERAKCRVQCKKCKEPSSLRGKGRPLRQSTDGSAIVPDLSERHHNQVLIVPFTLPESSGLQESPFVFAGDPFNLFLGDSSENP